MLSPAVPVNSFCENDSPIARIAPPPLGTDTLGKDPILLFIPKVKHDNRNAPNDCFHTVFYENPK